MEADLDLLLTDVYCTADDLLPERAENARRRVTDAEVVTLCVAQAVMMGLPSDRRFLAVAGKRLRHLFPELPKQPGFHKRRRRLRSQIEWLTGIFAASSPGYHDDVVLLDSTPIECGRSRETVCRSALADHAGYGYCASHSRFFWGFRLHLACAPDGTPRGLALLAAGRPEREVALELLPEALRGGEAVICDKDYAGEEFAERVRDLGGFVLRSSRKDEHGIGPWLAPTRQRIESVFWTCKDILCIERHGARTIEGLRERIGPRILALAACISLNHRLGRPSRALVDFVA